MSDTVDTAFADPTHGHRSTSFLRALGERRYEDAINLATTNGGNSYAADVRVVAAKAWLKEGLHDEARAHLEQMLTFYGSVGATWFVREINSLLAIIKHEQNASQSPTPTGTLPRDPRTPGVSRRRARRARTRQARLRAYRA